MIGMITLRNGEANMASNTNFEELLNERFDGDPRKVLSKYSYDSGEDIFNRLNHVKGFDKKELNDIVNMIVLWKVNRMVSINENTMNELYALRNVKTVEDILKSEDFTPLLSKLLKSKGIRLPMASTILHFLNPKVFTIFDQRAYRVIYKSDYKASTSVAINVALYKDYLSRCLEYYNTHLANLIDFEDVDKYLYQIDIEIGNTVKYN